MSRRPTNIALGMGGRTTGRSRGSVCVTSSPRRLWISHTVVAAVVSPDDDDDDDVLWLILCNTLTFLPRTVMPDNWSGETKAAGDGTNDPAILTVPDRMQRSASLRLTCRFSDIHLDKRIVDDVVVDGKEETEAKRRMQPRLMIPNAMDDTTTRSVVSSCGAFYRSDPH
jgi:hypothetical protein